MAINNHDYAMKTVRDLVHERVEHLQGKKFWAKSAKISHKYCKNKVLLIKTLRKSLLRLSHKLIVNLAMIFKTLKTSKRPITKKVLLMRKPTSIVKGAIFKKKIVCNFCNIAPLLKISIDSELPYNCHKHT